MRAFYKKGAVRSDEQAFNFHMRQTPLADTVGSSCIEEENKSTSNLNLSTSSRSYKPGISKSNSIVESNGSSNMNTPLQPNLPYNQINVSDYYQIFTKYFICYK